MCVTELGTKIMRRCGRMREWRNNSEEEERSRTTKEVEGMTGEHDREGQRLDEGVRLNDRKHVRWRRVRGTMRGERNPYKVARGRGIGRVVDFSRR